MEIMRLLGLAITVAAAWLVLHVTPVAAQTFEDRWSIIPKAKAEPAPAPAVPEDGKQIAPPPTQSPVEEEQTSAAENRVAIRSPKRALSGKASYYSYRAGKTASGFAFNRNLMTAAHRTLPFGTRVRVTDPATSRSVIVTINDRGPRVAGRMLDLSLGAARTLRIIDRGVVHVRVEVL
ncbi:septal ring lytic transglycosylase RlpA family protein [Bradyrhizobium sp. USDA 3256]